MSDFHILVFFNDYYTLIRSFFDETDTRIRGVATPRSPVLDFSCVSRPGWIPMLAYSNASIWSTPHFWCNPCWPLDGQHGSQSPLPTYFLSIGRNWTRATVWSRQVLQICLGAISGASYWHLLKLKCMKCSIVSCRTLGVLTGFVQDRELQT